MKKIHVVTTTDVTDPLVVDKIYLLPWVNLRGQYAPTSLFPAGILEGGHDTVIQDSIMEVLFACATQTPVTTLHRGEIIPFIVVTANGTNLVETNAASNAYNTMNEFVAAFAGDYKEIFWFAPIVMSKFANSKFANKSDNTSWFHGGFNHMKLNLTKLARTILAQYRAAKTSTDINDFWLCFAFHSRSGSSWLIKIAKYETNYSMK
jgi:hypothetical protein